MKIQSDIVINKLLMQIGDLHLQIAILQSKLEESTKEPEVKE